MAQTQQSTSDVPQRPLPSAVPRTHSRASTPTAQTQLSTSDVSQRPLPSAVPPTRSRPVHIDLQRPSHTNANNTSHKPSVLLIGNDHLHDVETDRLIPQAMVSKRIAFKIHDAVHVAELESIQIAPDCIILHEITNDISIGSDPTACARYLHSVIEYFAVKFPSTQFMISLGLPRCDFAELTTTTEIINALLKRYISSCGFANIHFCDHSNFIHFTLVPCSNFIWSCQCCTHAFYFLRCT